MAQDVSTELRQIARLSSLFFGVKVFFSVIRARDMLYRIKHIRRSKHFSIVVKKDKPRIFTNGKRLDIWMVFFYPFLPKERP